MPTRLKLTYTKNQFQFTIINALHIDTEDFETRVIEQLPYESYINFWINRYYHTGVSVKQAIILLYQNRNRSFINSIESMR